MSVFSVKFLFVLLFSQQQITHVIDDEMADGPVILRRRRAAQPEKNTCQLFIQTDHLFFKYYGTREAVIAQVHLKHRCLNGKWCLLCFILHIYRVVLLGCTDFQSREGHWLHLSKHGFSGHPQYQLHGEENQGECVSLFTVNFIFFLPLYEMWCILLCECLFLLELRLFGS